MLVGLSGLAAVGLLAFRPAPARTAPLQATVKEARVSLLVASRMLHAGQLLGPQDIATRDFPVSAVPTAAIEDKPATRSGLIGALLRVTIPVGGLVFDHDLVKPGDHSYLAAVLLPGKRAVSIGVDSISGVAGLIWPGDHVDLILTQAFDDPAASSGHRMSAETVLSGLRVIATNQDLVRGEQPASAGADERTITLEASPQEAERISIASRLGRLSLSVCSTEACEGSRVSNNLMWGSDVSPALAAGGGSGGTVHIFNGATDAKDFHFQ